MDDTQLLKRLIFANFKWKDEIDPSRGEDFTIEEVKYFKELLKQTASKYALEAEPLEPKEVNMIPGHAEYKGAELDISNR